MIYLPTKDKSARYLHIKENYDKEGLICGLTAYFVANGKAELDSVKTIQTAAQLLEYLQGGEI